MADRVRLAMLFALRYEKEGDRYLQNIIDKLRQTHTAEDGRLREQMELIRAVLQYGGTVQRTGDLFGNKSLFSRASTMAKGLKGVDNVYTQHQPMLVNTLSDISKGKLKESDYPYLGTALSSKDRVHDVIVFIVGGKLSAALAPVHMSPEIDM